VAGTNGKGSVTLKCARVLETLGFKTGMFISPHISSFRERIRINGEMISVQKVVEYTDSIFETIEREKLDVTFFEIVTMIAFLHYRDNAVDYAVIECGLGGRNDATNIIQRVSCAAIASIGKDHEETIGPELSDIAYEKAGIIKAGLKECVIGPTCKAFEVFAKTCESQGCRMTVVDDAEESFYNINKKIAIKTVLKVLEGDGHVD
jgi:dihydrofolate synthase / folylpolyglutamate synthase